MFPSPLYLTCMCVSDNAHKSHLEKVNNFLESKFYIKFCGKKGKIYTYIEHFFVFVVKFNAIFPKCSDYCGKSYPLSCVMFFVANFRIFTPVPTLSRSAVRYLTVTVHIRFRGSVNCWAPSMENCFQVAKFVFEVQKASSLFCLVQNGPGVTWDACICLG